MSQLQIIDCEQNTPEWLAARCGIPTASEFHSVRAGGEGKVRLKYLRTKAYERLTGTVSQSFAGNAHTRRGHEQEPEARRLAEFMQGYEATLVGFMRRGQIGCSPDYLVGPRGMGQIKTLAPDLMIELLENGVVPSHHMPQLQGELLVSAREWNDFVAYCPGLPLFVKRVHRDEKYIASLKVDLDQFNHDVDRLVDSIRSQYGDAA